MNAQLQQERIQTLWHFTKNKTEQTTTVCMKACHQNPKTKELTIFQLKWQNIYIDMSSNLRRYQYKKTYKGE
jgi:hypothetical protein